MDIYDYLKMDHKKVAKLFDLYKTATSQKNKMEIMLMINEELMLHADAEANTFYKALAQYRKSAEEVLHGEEEHEEIKQKLKEIVNLKSINANFEKKVFELKSMVDHHVSDEEGNIFNIAKKVLSEREALVLKEQMHDYKEKMWHTLEVEQEELI